MIISPPFLPASGQTASDASKPDPMMDLIDQFEIGHHGVWPVTFDRRSHCAIHLHPGTQGAGHAEPVRAIADGEVVAYRVCKNGISDGATDSKTGQPLLNSNAGFVLLRHTTDTGEGRTLAYYSLYMHLLDMTSQEDIVPQPNDPPETGSANALPKWLLDTAGGKDGMVQMGGTKRVYRRDMLGYVGQHQGVAHLHFEIFMEDGNFTAWFDTVQIGLKKPAQPTTSDYWGHSYFVISGPQEFYPQPAGMDETWFPRVPGGSLGAGDTLYVEAWFDKGQRFTRAWIDRGGSGIVALLTPDPVADPYDNAQKHYEYDLYERAMALYPACPSDGYEMLRFGRILSEHSTLTQAACATWIAVPFDENGTLGYVNIAPDAIKKLSDADFPFFTGWQKVDDDNTPFNDAGRCDYATLCGLTGIQDSLPSAQPLEVDPNNNNDVNLQLASYVQNTDGVDEKLRGMVFKARSEWDPSNNEERYKDLNDPYGFFGKQKDTNPDGYKNFTDFLSKFQFLDKTPLAGQQFWFFHPLAFIRHFRKCGWLSRQELQHLLPKNVVQKATPWKWQTVHLSWAASMLAADNPNAIKRRLELNNAIRKYGIQSPARMASFFGNATEETQWFQKYHEGSPFWYAPWDGRGMLQLTHATNYIKYWKFKGIAVSATVEDVLKQHTQMAGQSRTLPNGHKGMYDSMHYLRDTSTHIPADLIEKREAMANPFEAADSAGCYWAWSGAACCADEYWTNQSSEYSPLSTDHGIKYFYINGAFGKVAATINTGKPSSNYNSVWDIQSRFLSFANAQIILFDVTSFPQPDGSTSIFPVGFGRVEES
ncbi:hypothetical protein AB4Y42_23585 [Paraburkholderia sp. EG286B]|uniref:hypothetical protein n=1 Tax=Paraburkholderia sp. EG286B TaxID=3237011 RepID=UPI0034D1E744